MCIYIYAYINISIYLSIYIIRYLSISLAFQLLLTSFLECKGVPPLPHLFRNFPMGLYGISKITKMISVGISNPLGRGSDLGPPSQVYLRISQRLLPRAGAKLLIACAPAKRLQMRQSLQQQGIVTWTWEPRTPGPGSFF